MASISADCPHSATVPFHCPAGIMVLVLTCPELHALHYRIIRLFWAGSAFAGSVSSLSQSSLPCFVFCPCIFLPCLALHTMSRGAGTGSGSASAKKITSCSFLVCHLNYNFSLLKINYSIHLERHFSLFSCRKKSLRLVISRTSNHRYQTLCYLGTHQWR